MKDKDETWNGRGHDRHQTREAGLLHGESVVQPRDRGSRALRRDLERLRVAAADAAETRLQTHASVLQLAGDHQGPCSLPVCAQVGVHCGGEHQGGGEG